MGLTLHYVELNSVTTAIKAVTFNMAHALDALEVTKDEVLLNQITIDVMLYSIIDKLCLLLIATFIGLVWII